VYQFALTDKGHEDIESEKTQTTPPKKKKQRKRQSLWLNHCRKSQQQKKDGDAKDEKVTS